MNDLDPLPDVWARLNLSPRRWQAEAVPIGLEAMRAGEWGVISAIMGAGKTKACAALTDELMRLPDRPSLSCVVVLVPSKSLVEQTVDEFRKRLPYSVGSYFTEVKEPRAQVVVCCYPSLSTLIGDLGTLGRKCWAVIVDEVHKSEGEKIRDTLPQLKARMGIGFTATPYRSIPKESLSLWTRLLYRYDLNQALAEGVLVPFRHLRWDGQGSDDVDEISLSMLRQIPGPSVVSAMHIADAEAYAERLSGEDWPSEAIHSRLSKSERARRMAALQAGELRTLVHVALLAEGVDMPWLYGLVMRRPVSARVRFNQELGRPLRAHPGKTCAWIGDPHDLLTVHGMTTAEALGEALTRAAEAEEAAESSGKPGFERKMPKATAICVLLGHLADLTVACQEAGVLPTEQRVKPGAWRDRAPTQRQADALVKCSGMTARLPTEYREPVKSLMKHPYALTQGQVSDLLHLVIGVHEWAKVQAGKRSIPIWYVKPPALSVDAPPELRAALATMDGEA